MSDALRFDDDGALRVNPTIVGRLDSVSHKPVGGKVRECIHLRTKKPPPVIVLDLIAVGRLNFQPVVALPPSPCIASRMGDILTIAFDRVGGGFINSNDHRGTPVRWSYRLHSCRWDGQDHADPKLVAAVRISDQPNGTP